MGREKISKYRSEVIEKFINIECIINGIIFQHYFKKVIKPFLLEVLYDENFNFRLRLNILKKIEKIKQHQKNSEQEINNLFEALMQKAFNGELVN